MNGPSTSYSLLPNDTSPSIDKDSVPFAKLTKSGDDDEEYAKNESTLTSLRTFSESTDESRPLRGASDSLLYRPLDSEKSFESGKKKRTRTESSDSDFRPVSRPQRPRLWQLRSASQAITAFPQGYRESQEEEEMESQINPRIPPGTKNSLIIENELCAKSGGAGLSRSGPCALGFQLENSCNEPSDGGRVQSIINSLPAPSSLGTAVGAASSNDFANTRNTIEPQHSHETYPEKKASIRNDDDVHEVDEEEPAEENDPYYAPDEATESWRLVRDEDRHQAAPNWFPTVRNLGRPSTTHVNSAYNADGHGRSYDSLTPENDFVSLTHKFGPLPSRRSRTGSAIVLDSGMTGQCLIPNHNYTFSRMSESRKSSSSIGSRGGRKSSLYHSYGSRPATSSVSLQMRRQSAATYPYRYPPVHSTNYPPYGIRPDFDQRRTSTPSLAAVSQHRSPSQQVSKVPHACVT